MPWHARIVDDLSLDRALIAGRYAEDGDTASYVTALTFVTVRDGMRPPGDAVFLRGRDAVAFLQAMMDAAYEAGLRPSRAQDERHLKAHLEDMRRLAFHAITGEKPSHP